MRRSLQGVRSSKSLEKQLSFPKSNQEYASVIEFDVNSHVRSIQNILGRRIVFKLITKDAPKTFLERGLISKPEQYGMQAHLGLANQKLAKQMDKHQLWITENISQRPELLDLEERLKEKLASIYRRKENIKNLMLNIGEALKKRKLTKLMQAFQSQVQRSKIALPQNKNFEIMAKKFEKQRLNHQKLSKTIFEQEQKVNQIIQNLYSRRYTQNN